MDTEAISCLISHASGFLSAISEYERLEQAEDGVREYERLAHNLDPLFKSFAGFHSEENLSSMIDNMFDYLDVDESAGAVYLCACAHVGGSVFVCECMYACAK